MAWLRGLYPDDSDQASTTGRLGTLQPDVLAEYLAVDTLNGYTDPQLADVFTGLSAAQAERALTVLGRADQPNVPALIDAALAADPLTMAGAVIGVATQFPGLFAPRLAARLAITALPPDQLRVLADRVPYPSRELNPVALALTTAITAEDPTGTDRADRATWLEHHSARLAEAGRPGEALQFSTEAVALYRGLATDNPDTHLADLAMSLNNHAAWLTEASRPGEALQFSTEAVTLRRGLATDNPDTHQPDLAMSLNNQAILLAEACRPDEALQFSTEAVTLYRGLATDNPDAYLPKLAGSVHNHAIRLAEAGRPDEALQFSTGAVALYRGLTAARPDAFRPALASSLNNLSVRLADLGQREDALAAIAEASDAYRELAARWPDVFQDDLQRSQDLLDQLERGEHPGDDGTADQPG